MVCLLFLALGTVTYSYYQNWKNDHQAAAVWALMPESTPLVYMADRCKEVWDAFQKKKKAKDLVSLPFFSAIKTHVAFFENLVKEDPAAFNELPLKVSIHGVDQTHVDYVFYFNLHHAPVQQLFEKILKKIAQNTAYHTTERSYAGHTIIAVTQKGRSGGFAYIIHKNHLIGSCSSALLKAVIHHLASPSKTNFCALKDKNTSATGWYVNFKNLPQLFKVFFKHDNDTFLNRITNFAQASQVDFRFTDHHLLGSGFTCSQDPAHSYFIHTLAQQTPQPFALQAYIPNSTVMLQHFTFDNLRQWQAALQKYAQAHASGDSLLCQDSAGSLGFLQALLPVVQGALGHCRLETGALGQADQLLFVQVIDVKQAMTILKQAGIINLSSTHQQQFLQVYRLQRAAGVCALLSQLFPNFSARYLATLDHYIVLANSETALATLAEQYQNRQAWSNADQHHVFLNNMLDKANYSVLINIKKTWPQVMNVLKPVWQQMFAPYAQSLQAFEHLALQWAYEEECHNFYTSILLKYTDVSQTVQPSLEKIFPWQTFQADAPFITQPFLVKTHLDQNFQVLLQDSLYQLYFLNHAGTLVWKKPLDGPIITDVFEVDFYKNNKIQYLFATPSCLHLLDRYGRQVHQYPHKLPHLDKVAYLKVIDYDSSKEDYRFLVADQAGRIYLYDQYFKLLPGWDPKFLQQGFPNAPFHVRMHGKDYLMDLQRNGRLNVLNRRGNFYQGWPVDLKQKVGSPLYIKLGSAFAHTMLTVLLANGTLVSLNLEGIIKQKIQLNSLDTTDRFTLCTDQVAASDYVIMRQSTDKLTLFDQAGLLLFEKPYAADKPLLLQYYNFGANGKVYAVTDCIQNITYVYDQTGKCITDAPLANGHAIALVFLKNSRQLAVYSTLHKQYAQYLLPY